MIEKWNKLKDLDKYVIRSIAFVVLYTVAEFIVATVTGVSHEVLTTCVYGFFAGEIISCAMIKKHKLKRGTDV